MTGKLGLLEEEFTSVVHKCEVLLTGSEFVCFRRRPEASGAQSERRDLTGYCDNLSFALEASGPVFLHVGTAFVVPTDGQVYDPTDGAVVVPRQ